MGAFNVKATIWKITDSTKRVELELTVDIGSTYVVIPERVLGRVRC